jgi:hypothetical protein
VILKIYLVRHPKKKDDDKKPAPNDDPTKDGPPEAIRSAEADESNIKKGLNKIFWLRVCLGILAGTLSAIMGISMAHAHDRAFIGLGMVIVLFIVSYGIAKALRIPILPSDKRKLITTGYGSYFMMFLFSWILVNTLIHASTVTQSVR